MARLTVPEFILVRWQVCPSDTRHWANCHCRRQNRWMLWSISVVDWCVRMPVCGQDKAGCTLIRVQVRVRISLHELARVAICCSWQCYVTWTLHYDCHNSDAIVDVETFWRLFLLFSWRNWGTVHKNCSYFKVTGTRILNLYYCERLLLEYIQTHVYYNPD